MNKILKITISIMLMANLCACSAKNEISRTTAVENIPTPTIIRLQEENLAQQIEQEQEIEIHSDLFENIDTFIQREVDNGFPGAVLLIAQNGKVIHQTCFGYAQKYDGLNELDEPINMQTSTYFDVASLTKIYGTTFGIMKLVNDGQLSLDDKISDILDGFDDDTKKDITIRMLLRHSAGYPANIKFYKPEAEAFYSLDRNKTLSLLSQVELINQPGETYQYSDIGFMILGSVIESVSGKQLNQYLNDTIYTPLGIENQIMYKPLENGICANNIAATERMGNTRDGAVTFPQVRDYTLQGEVHDEKAYYSMGQISGHAGLFANANALFILSQVLLNDGEYNEVRIFSPDTVKEFMTIKDDGKYQLGFRQAITHEQLKGIVPPVVFYNNGWTGVASVIDPENDLIIILLTNKRHSPCEVDAFEGNDLYQTGKYIPIIKMIYKSFNESK